MPKQPHDCSRFIQSVHRRLLLLNGVEQLGKALLLSSILTSLMIAVAIWQSLPAWPALILLAGLTLLLGIPLAIQRRPTKIQAAAQADQQLRMHDLLTSAMSAMNQRDEFSQAVVAMADARCALHSPSEVLLAKLGLKSWTAIGLSTAIALSLAIVPLNPARSQAVDSNLSALTQDYINDSTNAAVASANPSINNATDQPSDQNLEWPVPQSTDASAKSHVGARSSLPSQNKDHGIGKSSSATPVSQSHQQTVGSSTDSKSNHGSAGSGGAAANSNSTATNQTAGIEKSQPGSPVPSPTFDTTAISPTKGTSETDIQTPAADRDLIKDFFNQR